MHSSTKLSIQKNLFLTNDFSFNCSPARTENNIKTLTQNIYEAHEKLSALIKNLEEKVKKTLEKQENDFFFAYRSHMSRVQMDLRELKKQIEENEKNNQGNEKIRELEKQLQFYKTETESLSKKLNDKTKEAKNLKESILILQSEKRFIENKLIAVLSKKSPNKRNSSFHANSKLIDPKTENRPAKNQVSPISELRSIQKMCNLLKPKDVMYFVSRYRITDEDEFALDFEEILRSSEAQSKRRIEILAAKIEQLKKTNIFLNYELNKNLQTTNDLKSHLENCFISVKNQIKKRKNLSFLQRTPQAEELKPNQAEIKFQDFRVSDKMKVLAYVLSDESLMQFMIEKIFEKSRIEGSKLVNDQEMNQNMNEFEHKFNDSHNLNDDPNKLEGSNTFPFKSCENNEILEINIKEEQRETSISKKVYLKDSYFRSETTKNNDEKETCTPETFSKEKYSSKKMKNVLKVRGNFKKGMTLTDRVNNSFDLPGLQITKMRAIHRKKDQSFAL